MVPAALPARSEPNGVNVVVLSVAKSDADCANAFFFAPANASMLVPASKLNVRLFIFISLP
jgi:hypothetical protein